MLASTDPDALWILPGLAVFVIVLVSLGLRAKARSERLRVLEAALEAGADRATVEALAYQLTGRKPVAPVAPPVPGSRFQALLLALGWLTMFAGLGVWVLSLLVHSHETGAAGVLTALVGFGLVTYPFALRELEARRPTN